MEEEVGRVRGKREVKQHPEGKGAETVLGMKSGQAMGPESEEQGSLGNP